jgi:3-hexulose-6-phosphate synthase
VHTGVDQQALGRTPLDDLRILAAGGTGVPLAVAGGISRSSAADYLALRPHIVIVGSGITGAADPAAEAARLHEIIRGAHR